MRKVKLCICILLIFLIISSIICFLIEKDEKYNIPISFEVFNEDIAEEITCWNNGEEYYVFLPSYAKLSKTRIRLQTSNKIKINGVDIEDGCLCDDFEVDKKYDFKYTEFFNKIITKITFLQSKNTASVHLTTSSGNMDYIHNKKGNYESGEINVIDVDGNLNCSQEIESLKGRGNYTWDFSDKKPYSLNLKHDSDILGMGKASKWILLANAFDESHLKNKIVFDFSKKLGMNFSPDSQWVTLYANGEYLGLYLLTERNEVQQNRVDISTENSFLVSLERKDRIKAQNLHSVHTKNDQYLRIRYPAEVTDEYLEELTSRWQMVENAIISKNGIDKDSGKHWKELIDIDSWSKKYLIEELFCNGDACYISQFFYCDSRLEGGRIQAGPVWDYDSTMGDLDVWEFVVPNTLYGNRYHVKDGYDTPWFYNLYLNEEFYNYVVKLYENEFLPELKKLFNSDIYEYANLISKSRDIDGIRWGNHDEKAKRDENFISQYMNSRIEFLNDIWLNESNYNVIKADQGFGAFYGYFYVKDGECFEKLPEFENTDTEEFLGWYYVDTAEPFDESRPIYEDVEVYAKWQGKPSKRISQLIKLTPLAVIFVLFIGLCFIEFIKYRKKLVCGNG